MTSLWHHNTTEVEIRYVSYTYSIYTYSLENCSVIDELISFMSSIGNNNSCLHIQSCVAEWQINQSILNLFVHWVWWKSVGSLKSLGYCPRKSRLIPAVMLPETWNSQNYTFYRFLHFFSTDNVKRKMLLPNLSSICALAIKSFIIRSC